MIVLIAVAIIFTFGIAAIGISILQRIETDKDIGILCMIGFLHLFYGGLFVLGCSIKFYQVILFERSPYIEVLAKVVSKTSKNIYIGGSPRSPSRVVLYKALYIVFEFCGQGIKKTINVNKTQCNAIQENEVGLLTYKEHGKHRFFISFRRQP